ncbi:MAG: hypothetical protein NWR72_17505 [Bacteroidia bacterium]|nr:hypothetical protein [Bacteroidia bacterium]
MKKFFQDLQTRIEATNRYALPAYLTEEPLASKTSWAPLKPGGSSFKTHRLKEASAHRVAFVSTVGARIFAMVFAVVGLVAMGFGSVIGLAVAGWLGALGGLCFGGIFLGVGIWMYREFDREIVFDLQDGMFWRNKRPNRADSSIETEKEWCRIEDIAAIQLIREHVSGKDSSFNSYEINLVLKDGSRLNVVDHGGVSQVLADSEVLGRFLGVPVWGIK